MRFLSALVLSAAVLALSGVAYASGCCGTTCNQCPVAQESDSVGMDVVCELTLTTADDSELES